MYHKTTAAIRIVANKKKQKKMKKYTLAGFSALVTLNGETLTVTVNGKEIKPKKGGAYSLKCTDDSGNVEGWEPVIGTAYDFTAAMLLDGEWETESANEPAAAAAAAAEPAPVDANQTKLKDLEKKMKASQIEMTKNLTSPKIAEFAQALQAARNEYQTFKDSLDGKVAKVKKEKVAKAPKAEKVKSAEELASEAAINTQKEAVAVIVANLKTANEALAGLIATHNGTEGFGKFGKVKKTGRGAHSGLKSEVAVDYAMAQDIRKFYAELISAGKTKSDATNETAEKFNVNPQVIKYKVTYRQNLLRKGDTAFVAWDNAYYNRFEGENLSVCFPTEGLDFTTKNNKWHAKIHS